MLKKFNGYMSIAICYLILFVLFGIILTIFPDISNLTISYIISIGLIVNGITLFFKNEKYLIIDFISLGVISLVLGLIMLLYPKIVITLIPIVVGTWMIVSSVFKIRLSLVLKDCQINSWVWTLLLAILTIICGILMIINPQIGASAITSFIGILMIIYSASSIVDLIIFKNNVNSIVKSIEKSYK